MTVIIDVTNQFPIPLIYPRERMIPRYIDAIAIHHTAVEPNGSGEALLLPASAMSMEDELNHIRVIHLYHKSKGYGGFAYHFIAFPSGRVYQVVPLTQMGSHVAWHNDHLIGVVVAGDFTRAIPGLLQQLAAARALDVAFTFINYTTSVHPHRRWGGTTCPGEYWEQWVPKLTDLIIEEDDMCDEARIKAIEDKLDGIALEQTRQFQRLKEILARDHGWIADLVKEMDTGTGATKEELREILNQTHLTAPES